jgi:thymidylate kinase
MKGIIVIDGCDGTGKTTLAKAICDRFDGVYIHNTYR